MMFVPGIPRALMLNKAQATDATKHTPALSLLNSRIIDLHFLTESFETLRTTHNCRRTLLIEFGAVSLPTWG